MKASIVFPMLFFLLISLAAAHEDTESVEGVLSEIQASQGAASIAQIDCSKIPEHQFEELGDALMEKMHPGEAHSVMDSMMGGEGSQSLKAMHAAMGNTYLKCDGSGMTAMMPMMMNMMGSGMMGSGMMGSGMMGSGGMMGSNMMAGQAAQTSVMPGMMGNNLFGFGLPFWGYGSWSIWNILFLVLLVGLIALVFLGVLKLLKSQ